jgi:hypothetical protein
MVLSFVRVFARDHGLEGAEAVAQHVVLADLDTAPCLMQMPVYC